MVKAVIGQMPDQESGILAGGRLRIGIAQKVVNLYLKYLWTMGWIEEPPHCPFDGIIIEKLKAELSFSGCFEDYAWTKLDCMKKYGTLVAVANDKAKNAGQSLAEWECAVFNKVRTDAEAKRKS